MATATKQQKENAALRRAREAKGWTKKEMASRANLSEATVRKAEAGEDVTRNSKVRLANSLERQISELFPGEPD